MLKHAPLIAFAGFSIRLIALGASVGDALALVSLAGLYGALQYLETKKQPDLNEAVLKEVSELRSAVNAMKVGNSFRGR